MCYKPEEGLVLSVETCLIKHDHIDYFQSIKISFTDLILMLVISKEVLLWNEAGKAYLNAIKKI